jgi:hypothetical protein
MKQSRAKSFHTGTVKKTIVIKASKQKVWRRISDIVGLPSWLIDVKKTVYLSKKKRGVGAIRHILQQKDYLYEHMLPQFRLNQKVKIRSN